MLILKIIKTNRTTWVQISVNGKTVGWMNKKELDCISIYLDLDMVEMSSEQYLAALKKKILKEKGYEVIMSIRTDKFVSLSNRAQEANKLKAGIFVSIYHNAFMKIASGIETYSYNGLGNSKNIISNNSKCLLNSAVLSNSIHKKLINNTGANVRNNRKADSHGIREPTIPAVLLELGYMDNTQEKAELVIDTCPNKLAKGLVEGIVNYFN